MAPAENPGFLSSARAPFTETAKLLRPSTAKGAWKDLWHGSANTHAMNREFLQDELADATQSLRDKKIPGLYVDDIAHKPGIGGSLRRGGWLGNCAKYEGPSKWRKGLNTVARHLPGQRALLVGGTAANLASDLNAQDETGRQRGMGERALSGAGGGIGSLGASAPAAVRAMSKGSWGGMAGGLLGSAVLGTAGSKGGGYLGRKFDEVRGFKPSAPPEQGTG